MTRPLAVFVSSVALALASSGCDPDSQLPLPGDRDVATSTTSPGADMASTSETDSGLGNDATSTTSPPPTTSDAYSAEVIELGGDTGAADDASDDEDTTPSPPPGGLCGGCQEHDDCGGAYDLCLQNNNTGEVFCGQYCESSAGCPGGFACVSVGGIGQCVPESETCGDVEPPPTCEPTCPSGEVCVDGACVEGGQYEAELQHCVDVINQHRAAQGRSALTRDSQIESCATDAAVADSISGVPHGHFQQTQGCGGVARAENEIPGWNLANYGSIENVIESGAQLMMDEGPGGGHHDNILNSSWTRVGCGIHVTSGGAVWVVHNFR